MICAMRMVLGLALLAGGCVADHQPDVMADPQPAVQPRTCSSDITLDGSTGSSPTKLALVLDTNGTSVCLHLDATHNLVSAHFAASTEFMPGASSPFTSVLQDGSFATLQDGWDVTVDDSPPRTFSNLEWNAPLHETTDAVLWIRSHGATTTTTLNLSLFEPFE
jgi:hypothetical protein